MSRRSLAAALSSAALLIVLAGASGAQASTTWLCKPGLADNPCTPGLGTTVISPTGAAQGTVTPGKAKKPKIDCFYVYPTVSDQTTIQATRAIDPEERSIALYQAARYSSDCRVYAPMYRQITLRGILQPDKVTTKMRTRSYN